MNGRRWGIAQAFVIAFYAEMYGFPVTIYLLARIFDLDVAGSFWDGNLWIYLTGAPEAMLVSMAIGYTIAFFGVMLLIAGWNEIMGMIHHGAIGLPRNISTVY